jgi:Rrf2 family transcriptional regulator, iron-sulfur cluster assembly transcription factor
MANRSPDRVSFPIATLLPPHALLAVAVVDVALQMEGRSISAKSLARHNGVASRSLEAMLQSLAHAGILEGSRGPHGGYRLARDRNAVTLSDILRAVGVDEEEREHEEPTSEIFTNVVLPLLVPAERALERALKQIDLRDLIRQCEGR